MSSQRKIVRKAFKCRLYPNRGQEGELAVQFGHARFVYNRFLSERKNHYKTHGKGLSYVDNANALVILTRQSLK